MLQRHVVLSVRLPARINIAGSPTDAVEGAYATISAAIPLYGGAHIAPASCLQFRRGKGAAQAFENLPIQAALDFDLETAAVNGFLRHAPELGARMRDQGAALQTWTDIPASSGLGGSSVLLLAILAALREFYGLDARRYNDYVLAEIAQRAEESELGVVCGFADRYVPLFGDIAYLSYHGKLWHAPLGEEPFVTYEKLGACVPPIEFCIATTGVQRDSGSVHAPMRERYLRERRQGAGELLQLARQLGETAWRGKIALLRGDLEALGSCIDRNQDLVDRMMRSCGFDRGVGEAVNALIVAARNAGALGAKLTGAGGGGAIFALPAPGECERIADALRACAAELRLANSAVFTLHTTSRGLEIEDQ